MHQQVIDSLVESLSNYKNTMFEVEIENTRQLEVLANSYSIIGGMMQLEYLLWQVDELQELKERSIERISRHKLHSLELLLVINLR